MSLGSAIRRVRKARASNTSLSEALAVSLHQVKEKVLTPDFWIGPSRLPELCPRAYTIAWRLGVPFVDQFDADARWRMDLGTGIHQVMQELWLGPAGWLLGAWDCPKCHHKHGTATIKGAVRCPKKCEACDHVPGFRTHFTYDEIQLRDEEYRIRGFTDGLGQLPAQPSEIWDVKSTGAIRYVRSAPRENDVKQLQIYMDMAGVHRGRLIYVDRMAKKFEGALVEHVVPYDESIVKAMKEKVRVLREALKAPKSEPSLPTCPNGGAGTYGPCPCKELDSAWTAHGP
jgi:hypothetical protein